MAHASGRPYISLMSAISAQSAPHNHALRGAFFMTLASILFAGMVGIVRHVSETSGLHAFELAFFRNLFGLLFMLPWLMHTGFGGLKTRRLGLYTVRGVFSILAMLSWFWAVTVMPLAEATALSFTTPIFTTILAALVLGEVVRIRRWTATVVGFLGTLLILRPGFVEVSPAALAVLFGAACIAAAIVAMKILARTESPNAIVTYMVLFLTPLSLPPALFVWQWPAAETWPWLVALGAVATAAHLCVTRAFAAADASAVMPLDFVRLPFVALIGYLAFAEQPDLWTWLGAAVIFGATVYITQREARLARASSAAGRSSPIAPPA